MFSSNSIRRAQTAVRVTLSLAACAGFCGCSSSATRTRELLEARLRTQDAAITNLEEQLQTTRWDLAASRQEVDALRASGVVNVSAGLPEQAAQSFRVDRIELNTLMSGGLNRDGLPGDENFTLLVAPKDPKGNVLRVDGELRIEIFDFTQPSDKQLIGSWALDRNQTAEMWHQGVVGTGFQFTAPWQQPPRGSELSVHTRLHTIDGRQFDNTSKLNVDAGPSAAISAKPVEREGISSVKTAATTSAGWKRSAIADEFESPAQPLLPE